MKTTRTHNKHNALKVIGMVMMAEQLKAVGVEHVLIDPLEEHGEVKPHCFVANERIDPVAAEAFGRLTAFLEEKTAR